MQTRGTPFAARAAIALALAAVSAVAPSASAHEGFVLTDNGIDLGSPPDTWREPALVLAGSSTAPAIAETFLYERQAATWDESTERLLTMGGGMSCCREFEERDVEGNLLGFDVFDQGQLPYRIEQLETMGRHRVIGWGWGPNWPDDFRLFTFRRSDPVATLRTRDVEIEPGGMVCLARGRAVVLLRDGSGLLWESGRGVESLVLPMRASWASFDGERLWMAGGAAGIAFVEGVDGPPASWRCQFAAAPIGVVPERIVSLPDGHTVAYGYGGISAFVGEDLTTRIAVPSAELPSRAHVAIGPGHRIWFSRAGMDGDHRGYLSIVDWFGAEPAFEVTLPGEVEAIATLPSPHEH